MSGAKNEPGTETQAHDDLQVGKNGVGVARSASIFTKARRTRFSDPIRSMRSVEVVSHASTQYRITRVGLGKGWEGTRSRYRA